MVRTEKRGVALVAGVALGFGEALCRRLSRSGYVVVGLARSDRVAKKLTDAIENAGGTYVHVTCDMTSVVDVKSHTTNIETNLGPIDVLVCNAHQLHIKSFVETTPDDFESVWRNSCFGAMVCAHAVLPGMSVRGQGTLIFTGATAAVRGSAKFTAFASAKFALRGMAQSLAREYAPTGIHVVHTILDGLIWEPQTRERFDPEQKNCMDPEALVDVYLQIIDQDRSVWTHEIDMRPFGENF